MGKTAECTCEVASPRCSRKTLARDRSGHHVLHLSSYQSGFQSLHTRTPVQACMDWSPGLATQNGGFSCPRTDITARGNRQAAISIRGIRYAKEGYRSLPITLFVIRMGLEPMTRSLEGCCSNPTELPNHPFPSGSRRAHAAPPARNECKGKHFRPNMQEMGAFLLRALPHPGRHGLPPYTSLRSSRTTFSTCWVCGNMSTGCMAATR